ncbi:MAG: helix-turn-helix transcriptional regulator [Woeseiaceae bacterium]|nr:helix-turn-helix transcriptional regulator [Woeseiaceae bacterium]
MTRGLDSTEWLTALGALVSAGDGDSLAAALSAAIDVIVDHEGTCLIAFHRDRAPVVVHHTLEPAGRRHYLDRYLAGPYLLDPLYQLALDDDRPTVCRFRDKVPDRFRSSEYYRQYCERTHLLDEMDYFADVSDSTALALVVGRRTKRFSRTEIDRLERIAPLVESVLRRVWSSRSEKSGATADDEVHARLTECFERFGESVLTERERQISQLLLRGHSSKSIARRLDIAPGTVMVHKRNLFSKLGISSQYQLFSLFIEQLGGQR